MGGGEPEHWQEGTLWIERVECMWREWRGGVSSKKRECVLMLSPVVGGLFECVAEDASPPPAA